MSPDSCVDDGSAAAFSGTRADQFVYQAGDPGRDVATPEVSLSHERKVGRAQSPPDELNQWQLLNLEQLELHENLRGVVGMLDRVANETREPTASLRHGRSDCSLPTEYGTMTWNHNQRIKSLDEVQGGPHFTERVHTFKLRKNHAKAVLP